MSGIRVADIQRMCFDDGPGIRTTVFLQGCSLHCPWCANPECIPCSGQTGSVWGKEYAWEELLALLGKDRKFWGADGGVTFSGGEALLQAGPLEPVWEGLKRQGIHVAVETALFVPSGALEIAMKYVDLYYVDVKILDRDICATVLGGTLEEFLGNVSRLAEAGADIRFRVPCDREHMLGECNRRLLQSFFRKYREYPVEIFSLHHLGDRKYRSLGLPVPQFDPATEEELGRLQDELRGAGCRVEELRL